MKKAFVAVSHQCVLLLLRPPGAAIVMGKTPGQPGLQFGDRLGDRPGEGQRRERVHGWPTSSGPRSDLMEDLSAMAFTSRSTTWTGKDAGLARVAQLGRDLGGAEFGALQPYDGWGSRPPTQSGSHWCAARYKQGSIILDHRTRCFPGEMGRSRLVLLATADRLRPRPQS